MNPNHFWLVDSDTDEMYHVNSTFDLIDSCNLNDNLGATQVQGITTLDGITFYVVDAFTNDRIYEINSTCGEISNFSIGSTTDDPSGIVMNKNFNLFVVDFSNADVFQFQHSFPDTPYLDVGDNGNKDWNETGEFNTSRDDQDINITAIQDFLDTCTADSNGNCSVPLVFHSDVTGIIEISDISISYSSLALTYRSNSTTVLNFTSDSTSWGTEIALTNNSETDINLTFSIQLGSRLRHSHIADIDLNLSDYFASWDVIGFDLDYENTTDGINWTDSFSSNLANITYNVTVQAWGINYTYWNTAYTSYVFQSNVTEPFENYNHIVLDSDDYFNPEDFHARIWVCVGTVTFPASCSTFSSAIDIYDSNNGNNEVGVNGDQVNFKTYTESSGNVENISFRAFFKSPFLFQLAVVSGGQESITSDSTTGGGGGSGLEETIKKLVEKITRPPEPVCPQRHFSFWNNRTLSWDCLPQSPPAEDFAMFMLEPRFFIPILGIGINGFMVAIGILLGFVFIETKSLNKKKKRGL